MDRISDLPDEILTEILSRLPTKLAVGTCTLSKRWQDIFPCGHRNIFLNLDDSLLLNPPQTEANSYITSFKRFVDKLFHNTFQDGPRLEYLNLECTKKYDEADIVSWITSALSLSVRYISLRVSLDNTKFLSQRLDGCKTLVDLTLAMKKSMLLIPYDFRLPSLNRLFLHEMGFDDGDGGSFNELIEGCPMLKHLSLINCEVSRLKKLSIKCPFLKQLVLEDNWDDSVKNITILEIHAPNLEIFNYVDSVACGYSISTFKSLLTAHIDVGPTDEHFQEGYYDDYYEYYTDEVDHDPSKYHTDISKIFVACSSTKHLYLCHCPIQALHYSSLQLPQYQSLTWLDLDFLPSEAWAVLARLLKMAPNLEYLGFEEEFLNSEMGFEDFELLLPSPPVCLEQRLKRIVFRKFDSKGEEIKLLNYFLQNGKVLEKIQLNKTEIPIRKKNDAVVSVGASYASSSCGISPPSSSSSSYDSRLVDIIRQGGLGELEHSKRIIEQLDQFNKQVDRQFEQWTLMEQMMSDSSDE